MRRLGGVRAQLRPSPGTRWGRRRPSARRVTLPDRDGGLPSTPRRNGFETNMPKGRTVRLWRPTLANGRRRASKLRTVWSPGPRTSAFPSFTKAHPPTGRRCGTLRSEQDYTLFVQAPPLAMHADPLCEVGAPTSRGFDLGLTWAYSASTTRASRRPLGRQSRAVHETAWNKTQWQPPRRKEHMKRSYEHARDAPPAGTVSPAAIASCSRVVCAAPDVWCEYDERRASTCEGEFALAFRRRCMEREPRHAPARSSSGPRTRNARMSTRSRRLLTCAWPTWRKPRREAVVRLIAVRTGAGQAFRRSLFRDGAKSTLGRCTKPGVLPRIASGFEDFRLRMNGGKYRTRRCTRATGPPCARCSGHYR